jgi:hypothetical protein
MQKGIIHRFFLPSLSLYLISIGNILKIELYCCHFSPLKSKNKMKLAKEQHCFMLTAYCGMLAMQMRHICTEVI